MFKNRLFDILMGLAFVAAVGFSIRTAVTPDQLVPSVQDLSDYSLRHPGTAISDNAQMTGTYLQGMQGLRQPGTAISVNAAAVNVRFPGKEQDDLVAAGIATDNRFPGKEQDDLVAAGIATDNRFPGKEQDDLVAAGIAIDKHFPGKEQDDIVAADLSDYFQRHSGSTIAIVAVASDWFERHPEMLNATNAVDLSDYYQRHPELLNAIQDNRLAR